MPRVSLYDNTSTFKHPGSAIDLEMDWSEWLDGDDVIASSSFTVPDGLTKDSESNTSTSAMVTISGGLVNVDYVVINTITTVARKTESKAIRVMVSSKGVA